MSVANILDANLGTIKPEYLPNPYPHTTTLTQVLAAGNTTGPHNITVNTGQKINVQTLENVVNIEGSSGAFDTTIYTKPGNDILLQTSTIDGIVGTTGQFQMDANIRVLLNSGTKSQINIENTSGTITTRSDQLYLSTLVANTNGYINTTRQFTQSSVPINQLYLPSQERTVINDILSTWTQRTSPASEPSYNRMTWSPTLNLFATVSQQGRSSRIATSPDGITWTEQLGTGFNITNVTQVNLTLCNNGPGTNQIICASTANLMIGTVINPGAGVPANCVVTAINSPTSFTTSLPVTGLANSTLATWGFTCTKTTQLQVGLLVALAVGGGAGSTGGRFVTAIDNTDALITKFVLTSTRNYAASTCYVDRSFWGCLWCPDLAGTGYFVASATTTEVQQIATSTDGVTWTLRNTPLGLGLSVSNMAYSPTLKRVVVAGGQPGIIYSDDAINWTYVANPTPTGQSMGCITWSSVLNQFVCVGFSTSFRTVFTSPDGITWTANTSTNLPFRSWADITYSPELQVFVAISPDSVAGNVAVSINGTYWESYSTPELNQLRGITWVPELGVFVVVAQSGTNRVFYSYDGRTWVGRPTPAFGFRGIAYSPTLDRFAISGSNSSSSTCLATSASPTYNLTLGNPPALSTLSTVVNLAGTVVCNTGALATTATDGFLYVPTCAGPPTGVPTTYTGRAPIVIDTTNNKLYFRSGGSWIGVP